MDKLKLFVIWLDGYMQACGPTLNEEQTLVIKDKLNNLFEHEAETINNKPTLEELGEQHGFIVTNNSFPFHGNNDGPTVYRC